MATPPTSLTVPYDPEGVRVHPDDISKQGGDEITGFLSGIAESYRFESAGQTYAYNVRLEDAYAENSKKLEDLGYKPRHLFDNPYSSSILITPNLHEASTFFQGLVNDGAPVPGVDERYKAKTEYEAKVLGDIRYNEQLISNAITEHPDAGIKTQQQLHRETLASIAKDRTTDPRGGLGQFLGGIIGGTASILNLRSNPYVIPEMGALVFGGVGPKAAVRILSMAAVGAAANVIPKLGSQTTLQMAGVPITNNDLIYTGVLGAIFGAGGGAVGEAIAGQAGRAALNERYSWMSISKRQARAEGRQAPQIAPFEPAPIPGAPPPTPTPSGLPAVIAGMEGAPPARLPGLPPAAPPSKLPALLAEQIPVPTTPSTVLERATAPVVYASKGQRVGLSILDRAETAAAKVRKAVDADHAAKQMEVPGVMAQDLVPASRPLSKEATIMPDVRVWGGPGAGEIPKLPPIWQRLAKDHDFTPEVLARELDPETWSRWDRVNKRLRDAEGDLQTATKFHEEGRQGVTTTLDKHIGELQAQFERARTAESKAAIHEEIMNVLQHHEDLKGTKGGVGPQPPKSLSINDHAARVLAQEASRDEIYQDIERSIARAQGRWGLKNAERDALEAQLRPGAVDRISEPWRWPKGTKRKPRPKGVSKNPYEAKLLKGPTTTELNTARDELFTEFKAQYHQTTDPLAAEVAKPGDTPQQVATKVNEAVRKQIDEVDADKFFKDAGDFIKSLESVSDASKTSGIGAARMAIPKKGGVEPVKPSLSAGMTWEQLMKEGKFELPDGQVVSLKQAVEDIHGEEEAFRIFSSCAVTP